MRVIALEKGARGVVKVGLDTGSLFLFRLAYLRGPQNDDADDADILANDGIPERIQREIGVAFARGQELEGPEWEGFLAAIERAHALYAVEKAALAFLARREHARAELEKKLLKKEYSPELVKRVLSQLIDEKLLSDQRYAENWIRSRLRTHPEGEFGLKAGLKAKGIDRFLATSEVEHNRTDILSGLARIAARIYASEMKKREKKTGERESGKVDPKSLRDEVLKKCYAKLRARGYTYQDVKHALAELTGSHATIDEGDDST